MITVAMDLLLSKNASPINLIFKERPDVAQLKQPPVTDQITSEFTGHGVSRHG
jgi:hypothetical protein